jgi:hypothetical protein
VIDVGGAGPLDSQPLGGSHNGQRHFNPGSFRNSRGGSSCDSDLQDEEESSEELTCHDFFGSSVLALTGRGKKKKRVASSEESPAMTEGNHRRTAKVDSVVAVGDLWGRRLSAVTLAVAARQEALVSVDPC